MCTTKMSITFPENWIDKFESKIKELPENATKDDFDQIWNEMRISDWIHSLLFRDCPHEIDI